MSKTNQKISYHYQKVSLGQVRAWCGRCMFSILFLAEAIKIIQISLCNLDKCYFWVSLFPLEFSSITFPCKILNNKQIMLKYVLKLFCLFYYPSPHLLCSAKVTQLKEVFLLCLMLNWFLFAKRCWKEYKK